MFCQERFVYLMNIFVYSDESGVFDYLHNNYFVFGGIIFLSRNEKDIATRKYLNAERTLRRNRSYDKCQELKAVYLSNADKGKLFRSSAQYQRFGIIINQNKVHKQIFSNKKDKQRYLDFAYKIGLKNVFEHLIRQKQIKPDEIENLYVNVDEHTTATNGLYELQESLEQEFKNGTYNWNYNVYFPPIFTNLNRVSVSFCNSEHMPLIRAADIIANRLYYLACNNQLALARQNLCLKYLP